MCVLSLKPMRKAVTAFLILLVCSFAFSLDTEVDTYCYSCLSASEQIAYMAINDCITHLIASWNCGSMEQEAIHRAFESLMMDHPEYYWTDSYTFVTSYVKNTISGHRVEFTYTMDAPQIRRRNDEITNAIYAIADELVVPDGSTYSLVKTVFDYLVDNCTYDETNLDQSLYSVMVNKSGVCASFSRAFEFIMQCLGIPCTVVFGHLTQNEGVLGTTLGHEWNIVQIDGKWYHVDVTSGLAVDENSELSRYEFLCIPTDQILATHKIENPVPIPDCTDDSLEFFRLNGLMVDTYSRQEVARAMLKAMEMGYMPVARFSNYRAFSEAIDDLITHQGIFKAIHDTTGYDVPSINYQIDEQNLQLRLILT